jgi:hypothetical protein
MGEQIEIGAHRLLCGDITTGAVAEIMAGDRALVIYSDPPWGPGNQQYWHTMNVRGSVPRTSWGDFLTAFCGACASFRTSDAPVFVEMGLRWVDELDAAMLAVGLPKQRRWDITYGPKKKPLPNTLTLYGHRDIPIDLPVRHSEPVTRTVLGAVVRAGDLVLDPCCGKGMTARISHALGARFRGTELNPKRLELTAGWLRKHGG